MKNISLLIIMLTLICHSQTYSQTDFQYALFAKRHTLKADNLQAVQKDGKTSWTVRTTLTNRSHRTMYYFITDNCDAAYYAVDTTALFVDFPKCDSDKLHIIALKPKQQRIVNLEINSFAPLTDPISFRIFMFIFKAKDLNDNVPHDELVRKRRPLIVVSNQIKT